MRRRALSVVLIAVYFSTYCVAFAGIGILNLMKSHLHFITFRYYFPFLLSFLAYILHKNSAFFVSVFLHRGEYLSGRTYLLLDGILTALFLFSYQLFYLNLSKNPEFKRIPASAWALPFPSLAMTAAWFLSETARGPNPEFRRILPIANSAAIFLVFAASSGFLLFWKRRSAPAAGNFIFRFIGLGNLVFLPFFSLQMIYDYGFHGPLAPLCVENLYFAVLNVLNIWILAKRVLVMRNRGERSETPETGLKDIELEVIKYIRRGMTNKAIAYELGVSEFVVKNYVHGMLEKTNTRNRVELLRKSEALGDGCLTVS
jgi:DNA-binding CsgD family transcriptional regulator